MSSIILIYNHIIIYIYIDNIKLFNWSKLAIPCTTFWLCVYIMCTAEQGKTANLLICHVDETSTSLMITVHFISHLRLSSEVPNACAYCVLEHNQDECVSCTQINNNSFLYASSHRYHCLSCFITICMSPTGKPLWLL